MREVNSLDSILRILGIILLALSATLGAGGRQPGDDDSTTSPGRPPVIMATPTPGQGGVMTPGQGGVMPVTAVPHVINSVEVFILESFPPQISLGVIGYQPDGCDFPGHASARG